MLKTQAELKPLELALRGLGQKVGEVGQALRTLKGLPSWATQRFLSPNHSANYFLTKKSFMFPCNSIRQEGGPKLSRELANYLLIAPSDSHLMNRMWMEENTSHKEMGAWAPVSITPLDVSHSSAVPAVAGAVSRCLGM